MVLLTTHTRTSSLPLRRGPSNHQFTDARRKHLTVNGRTRSFPHLLENQERVQTLPVPRGDKGLQ